MFNPIQCMMNIMQWLWLLMALLSRYFSPWVVLLDITDSKHMYFLGLMRCSHGRSKDPLVLQASSLI